MNENELEQLKEQEGHWVAVSDLMAGLMMVFMLISIVFMVNVETERNKIRDVAILYDHLRVQIYEDLKAEFEPDMARWGAELDKDLTFRFNNSEVLFDKGAAFPRFLTDVACSPKLVLFFKQRVRLVKRLVDA